MKIILDPFEFFKDSNLFVNFFLNLLKKIKPNMLGRDRFEKTRTILRQTATNFAVLFPGNLSKRKSKLDSEQYAEEVIFIEETRLNIYDQLNKLFSELRSAVNSEYTIHIVFSEPEFYLEKFFEFCKVFKKYNHIKIYYTSNMDITNTHSTKLNPSELEKLLNDDCLD